MLSSHQSCVCYPCIFCCSNRKWTHAKLCFQIRKDWGPNLPIREPDHSISNNSNDKYTTHFLKAYIQTQTLKREHSSEIHLWKAIAESQGAEALLTSHPRPEYILEFLFLNQDQNVSSFIPPVKQPTYFQKAGIHQKPWWNLAFSVSFDSNSTTDRMCCKTKVYFTLQFWSKVKWIASTDGRGLKQYTGRNRCAPETRQAKCLAQQINLEMIHWPINHMNA